MALGWLVAGAAIVTTVNREHSSATLLDCRQFLGDSRIIAPRITTQGLGAELTYATGDPQLEQPPPALGPGIRSEHPNPVLNVQLQWYERPFGLTLCALRCPFKNGWERLVPPEPQACAAKRTRMPAQCRLSLGSTGSPQPAKARPWPVAI